MKPWTKIYMDAMGYDISDFIPCEVCERKSVDTNHLKCRGMGGTKKPDKIENLMAMCRECHDMYADKKQYVEYLKEIHALRMKERGLTLK